MKAQITASDLLSQDIKRHPSAIYTPLREQEPLSHFTYFDGARAWVVSSYDDAITILKDPRFIKEKRKLFIPGDGQAPSQKSTPLYEPLAWRRDMLMTDPPDHTRLRHLVSQAFTPRMIEQLRPRVQQITDELLDAVQERGEMDLIADFAFPLPIIVILELLGVPAADRQQFRDWVQAITLTPDGPEKVAASASAEEAFFYYIKRLLAEKREHQSLDLISSLVQVEENGDTLSEIELISMIWLLIVAGHETTVGLIGAGTLLLLQHPEQMRLLQHDLSLLPSTVEELLRHTTPVSLSSFRWASEDIPLHGQVIHKGELVFIALIAANTDSQQFPDSEVLDLTRQVNKHLAFGKGIHTCLGAPLARLEGQIAFGTLLHRFPHLCLASDPEQLVWNHHPILRGLTSLPVVF